MSKVKIKPVFKKHRSELLLDMCKRLGSDNYELRASFGWAFSEEFIKECLKSKDESPVLRKQMHDVLMMWSNEIRDKAKSYVEKN